MALTTGTRERALREAMSLVQSNGYNGFSFQHVADALGIKKPSLYDHFDSKEALGIELIRYYETRLDEWRETISTFDPEAQLNAHFEKFTQFCADGGKLCPLGAFSSDFNSLPKKMQKELSRVLEKQTKWFTQVISTGQKAKAFRSDLPADSLAALVLSTGLGAQKLGRVSGDLDVLKEAKKTLFKALKSPKS